MKSLALKTILPAVAALSLGLLAGCSTAPAPIVVAGPPVAQVEVIPASPGPGWFWIGGHWASRYGRSVWVRGHWAQGRPGAVWIQGHYENRGGGYVWVQGYWR